MPANDTNRFYPGEIASSPHPQGRESRVDQKELGESTEFLKGLR